MQLGQRYVVCFSLWCFVFSAADTESVCAASGNNKCTEYFVPFKGGNLNHSGWYPHTGPFDLTRPSWIWEEPDRHSKGKCSPFFKAFHSSPMIDADLNVYIQSTTGWVYSINKEGILRWSTELTSCNPSNLALADGVAYTISMDGVAHALDMNTGGLVWSNKISIGAPDDAQSLTVAQGIVLAGCNIKGHGTHLRPFFADGQPLIVRHVSMGNEAVCALDAKTGEHLWTYEFYATHLAIGYNALLAIIGDTVILGDSIGGAYAASLRDGKEIWSTAPLGSYGDFWSKGGMPMGSTGNIVVGPDDATYHGFNKQVKEGAVRSLSIHTGKQRWIKFFKDEVNSAPAVGRVYGYDQLAVVVTVGSNPSCDPMPLLDKAKVLLGLANTTYVFAQVFVLKAVDGEVLWQFDLPRWWKECAGILHGDSCCPDAFGNPAIGEDGTVYVNWSGGKSYALRDANKDGKIDMNDPAELSLWNSGFGSNGITAIAPGLTVTVNCRNLMGYRR